MNPQNPLEFLSSYRFQENKIGETIYLEMEMTVQAYDDFNTITLCTLCIPAKCTSIELNMTQSVSLLYLFI